MVTRTLASRPIRTHPAPVEASDASSNVCRFCKTSDTVQSGHLLPCADGPPTQAPTSGPTPAPTLAPPTAPPSVCDGYAQQYGLAAGFVFEVDAECLAHPEWNDGH
ncbi:hypothetical protein PINS_up020902, partial [Pythium insidiosum]